MKDIIEGNKSTYADNNISAVNKIKNDIFASGDAIRTREIIENLQMNAVKFMPNGGALTFNAVKDKKEVIISVSDTGAGIEKEKLEKVFEEFFKIDESRHDIRGAGLGLTICRKMIGKMHGRIWTESAGLDKWTTIYFSLPIEKKK